MTSIPAFFEANGHATLEQIVEVINGGGSAMSSATEIAGYYAFTAAIEGSDDAALIDADTMEAHLDVLASEGANIDYSAAIADAMARLQADRAAE